MKKKLFLLLCLLAFCISTNDSYHVGECRLWRPYYYGDPFLPIEKIVEVNKFTYETQYWFGGLYWSGSIRSAKLTKHLFGENNIACPSE